MKMNKWILLAFCFLPACALLSKDTDIKNADAEELVVELGQSCETDFGEVPSGGSFVAYKEPQVPSGQSCVSETRVCKSGKVSGSYLFISCFEGNPVFGNEGDVPVVLPEASEAEVSPSGETKSVDSH